MIWKVEPKTITDEVGQEQTIIGITFRDVTTRVIDLNLHKDSQFYLSFIREGGREYNPRNVYSSMLISNLVAKGLSEEAAKSTVKSMIIALEWGTQEQIYEAASGLAESYGYELLPLENQIENVE